MGCDIHMYTEAYVSVNGFQKWVNVDNFRLNKYYGEPREEEYKISSIYDDRNYTLFAVLANVRNRSGCKFISIPKGIPENASPTVKKIVERWDLDGHSASWFTLAELKKFRDTQDKQKYSGYVSQKDSKVIDSGGFPSMYCGATNDPSFIYREWYTPFDTLDVLIERLEERKKDEFWLFHEGQDAEHDEDIRIVFFFDN